MEYTPSTKNAVPLTSPMSHSMILSLIPGYVSILGPAPQFVVRMRRAQSHHTAVSIFSPPSCTTFLLELASQPWTGAEKALLECYRGARCRGGLLPVHLRERACQPVREAIASTLSPSVSLRADGVGRCSSGWQCPSPFRRDAVGGGWMGGAAIVAN